LSGHCQSPPPGFPPGLKQAFPCALLADWSFHTVYGACEAHESTFDGLGGGGGGGGGLARPAGTPGAERYNARYLSFSGPQLESFAGAALMSNSQMVSVDSLGNCTITTLPVATQGTVFVTPAPISTLVAHRSPSTYKLNPLSRSGQQSARFVILMALIAFFWGSVTFHHGLSVWCVCVQEFEYQFEAQLPSTALEATAPMEVLLCSVCLPFRPSH